MSAEPTAEEAFAYYKKKLNIGSPHPSEDDDLQVSESAVLPESEFKRKTGESFDRTLEEEESKAFNREFKIEDYKENPVAEAAFESSESGVFEREEHGAGDQDLPKGPPV